MVQSINNNSLLILAALVFFFYYFYYNKKEGYKEVQKVTRRKLTKIVPLPAKAVTPRVPAVVPVVVPAPAPVVVPAPTPVVVPAPTPVVVPAPAPVVVPAPAPVVVPLVVPIRKYIRNVDMDIGGNDIACYTDGSSADFCREKCDNDPRCKGYNYIHKDTVWGAASGCCYKFNNQPLISTKGIDFYALN